MREPGPRVAITGVGAVSPAGRGAATAVERVRLGHPTATPITMWDASDHAVRFACSIDGFDPAPLVDERAARRIDRVSQFALVAADEALAHSGLATADVDPARVAVLIGSGVGGLISTEEQIEARVRRGPGRVSPLLIPMMMPNASAGLVSLHFGFRGPSMAVATACASGANAIGEGAELIRSGRADAVVCGGAEAAITPTAMAAFGRMGALSTRNDDPAGASRPFDRDRDGFVMGEGAGIVVLESEAHARRRGTAVVGWLLGHASTCDAHHITAPDPEGIAAVACMAAALADAGVAASEVGHINAHGTSTPLNDRTESAAIAALFGADGPPVTSTKGVTGHLIGAAGALEAIIALATATDGVIPPTAGLVHPDDDVAVDLVVGRVRTVGPAPALSNSLGFGGHNTSLVLGPA